VGEHDELQLIQRKSVAGGGERALEHHFSRLRVQYPRMLEREQKAAALGVELGELARRECAEARAAVGQCAIERLGRAQHASQPMQRFADVAVVEARRRKLACHTLAVIGKLRLLTVLE